MNRLLLMLLAVSMGALLPVQAALNARLARAGGGPVVAALASFAIGTVTLLLIALGSGMRLSSLAGAARTESPMVWLGGIIGAFYVGSVTLLTPRLGVALTFGLLIAGQLLLSVALDHFGLLGLPVQRVSAGRVAGILLLLVGVLLIRRF
ncbi:DMT family transporter [Hymenobacter oligotrophus]|uniref:DMT family transporter n=1 Tax=Hymenobacter oligotrophus TaxID=2319843 RepID=A0A3B7QXZ5_9BACT|nr:DMT family transporter [Hymenobacter oligotrophus]AYA36674.1 DMT family transporter [Hymenobacter oligotrophus]